MDWTPVLTQIMTIVVPVLGAVLTALGGYTIILLRKKSAEMQKGLEAQDLGILNTYVGIAEDAIVDAVAYVQQTLVDNLKGTEAWTPEKKTEVFEAAKKRAMELMSSVVQQAIVQLKGDLEKWVETSIEATIKNSKVPVAITA